MYPPLRPQVVPSVRRPTRSNGSSLVPSLDRNDGDRTGYLLALTGLGWGLGQAMEAEMDLCPRCGSGFVLREPFVRAETLARSENVPFEVRVQSIESGFFH